MAANDYYNHRLSMSSNTPLSQVSASPAPQGPPPPYQSSVQQGGPSRPPMQRPHGSQGQGGGQGWQYPSSFTEKPPLPQDPRDARQQQQQQQTPYPGSAPPQHMPYRPPPAPQAYSQPTPQAYPHQQQQQQQPYYPPQQQQQQQRPAPYSSYSQPQPTHTPAPVASPYYHRDASPGKHVRIQSPSASSMSERDVRESRHASSRRRHHSAYPDTRSSHHHHHHSSGSHSSKDKDGKKKNEGFGTFLGAGGGALVGDMIFPGLGTATGAILGGLSGRSYDRKRDGRGSRSYSESGRRRDDRERDLDYERRGRY